MSRILKLDDESMRRSKGNKEEMRIREGGDESDKSMR